MIGLQIVSSDEYEVLLGREFAEIFEFEEFAEFEERFEIVEMWSFRQNYVIENFDEKIVILKLQIIWLFSLEYMCNFWTIFVS